MNTNTPTIAPEATDLNHPSVQAWMKRQAQTEAKAINYSINAAELSDKEVQQYVCKGEWPESLNTDHEVWAWETAHAIVSQAIQTIAEQLDVEEEDVCSEEERHYYAEDLRDCMTLSSPEEKALENKYVFCVELGEDYIFSQDEDEAANETAFLAESLGIGGIYGFASLAEWLKNVNCNLSPEESYTVRVYFEETATTMREKMETEQSFLVEHPLVSFENSFTGSGFSLKIPTTVTIDGAVTVGYSRLFQLLN